MNSQYFKIEIAKYYRLRGYMTATEFGVYSGYADVYAITPEKQSIEVEVKISKQDLDSELYLVKHLWKNRLEGYNSPQGLIIYPTARYTNYTNTANIYSHIDSP